VKSENVMVEVSGNICLVLIKKSSVIKIPVRKGVFHGRCVQPIKGLLCIKDYGVRERVGGFQGVGEIDVNNSSKKGIREKGDICIISRIR